ncbi:ATP-binding protein [Noviherbaspirillum sedimenti]|uniref:Sensory/regulatory protein RpfC n=1 Tax=Noviherbaspirillum sedimenti TaxID=2320865 RepID=A0A3A3G312_9BURK|nr:ATP-binding protein [Noviherbaspirillum sedimenti]RJG02873.1 response regulator [Noviherbaspirillum sedimenti]
MTTAISSPATVKPAGGPMRPWLRFALPLLAISLLIGAVGAIGYRYLSEEVRRETHRTLAVIAEQKRQQIEGWFAEIRIDAELYFTGQSELEMLFGKWLAGGRQDAAIYEQMRARMEGVARARGWGGLAMLDTVGRPAVVIGEADIRAHDALIQDVLRRPRIELVDLHRNALGEVYFGILAPIGVSQTGALGVAYLTWRADQALYPQVGSWPVPTQTAETYLVRRDGDGVRFLTPLRHQPASALGLTRPLSEPKLPAARAAKGEQGILEGGRDYRKVPVLAYASAVKGTPWLMLAEIDEREAYAGIRTMAWATALAMVLGLLPVYFGGYLLWRRGRQRQELAVLQAQRAAEARFRVIFEQAPLGVALLDARSNRIVEANLRCGEILGRTPRELAGLDPASFTHPDDLAENRERVARMNAGELSGYRVNKRYLRPDGAVVWAGLTGAPLQVETEAAPLYLFILEDITARKQMEEDLRQAYDVAEFANAAKSEFLAHMSHEIRTPMNAVLGLAQVLERETLTAGQRDMVERIGTAGQSLLAILNDVLDLSKIEAGQLRIEPRPFELKSLLANLDSLMGRAARAKGLALHLEAPATPLGPLVGDGLRLEQVLINLIGNAIKFTGQGEVTVLVQLRAAGERDVRLRFEVRDQGIGIPPEALARLFVPFTQADAGISRRFGGTGLGLSICKRLVELMGGEIGADSQVGVGSSFWFELPFALGVGGETDALAAKPAPARSGPRLVGAHLLVADDSAMNRDLVERALMLEGASVTLAADGQQAVQLLKTRPEGFDAVLMDVQMPVMDGLTATRLIRGELGLTDLPVIAFTAGVRDEQQAAARAAGANDVLPKPMDLEHMAVLLLKWVKPRRSEEAVSTITQVVLADQPPAVADTVEDFPDIAGIDRNRAIKRLGGDRDMFLGLLERFVGAFADAAAQTRRDLAQGDLEKAARRMHTMRSNAGFLCALDLMELAGELEDAIDKGDSAQDARLAAMEREIAELIEASAPWRRAA